MTTINVIGKITALEVDDGNDFAIVTLAGGAPGSPTLVSPSGKPVTLVLATTSNPNNRFALDASFNVGDVVEFHLTAPGNGFNIVDENGVSVPFQTLRKILTGVPGSGFSTWDRIGG